MGSDIEHRVLGPSGTTLFTGSSTGRNLRSPTAFLHPDGSSAWTIRGAGKLSPHTWTLTDGSGGHVAEITASPARRGATEITLAAGRTLRFAPHRSLVSDLAHAAVLADGDRFVLSEGDRIVADTAPAVSSSGSVTDRSVADRLRAAPRQIRAAFDNRGGFHRSGSIETTAEFSAESPLLIGALLLFHDQVVHFMRSP